jgi:hypothetical protein
MPREGRFGWCSRVTEATRGGGEARSAGEKFTHCAGGMCYRAERLGHPSTALSPGTSRLVQSEEPLMARVAVW